LNIKRALTSKKAIPGYVLVALFAGYLGLDLVQKVRHSGIYRQVYAGTVIKTRRTFVGYLAITEGCSGSNRERRRARRRDRSRSSGYYVAKIQTEDGRTMSVSITRREYRRVRPGHYVISRKGNPTFYPSRAAAFKAVGAKP
jgi:hypothetical protein